MPNINGDWIKTIDGWMLIDAIERIRIDKKYSENCELIACLKGRYMKGISRDTDRRYDVRNNAETVIIHYGTKEQCQKIMDEIIFGIEANPPKKFAKTYDLGKKLEWRKGHDKSTHLQFEQQEIEDLKKLGVVILPPGGNNDTITK